MDDAIDAMLVEVRAGTQGFQADITQMRSSLDSTLVDGFEKAGGVLEHGLLTALRRGSLGFDDLKRTASAALDQIASQALGLGLDSVFGGSGAGGGLLGGTLNTALGALLGLPGRATGGPVSPGRGYIVGEREPELFVPTSAGRVEANSGASGPRTVNVAIRMAAPRGASAPTAMRRSNRQIASAVSRALRE